MRESPSYGQTMPSIGMMTCRTETDAVQVDGGRRHGWFLVRASSGGRAHAGDRHSARRVNSARESRGAAPCFAASPAESQLLPLPRRADCAGHFGRALRRRLEPRFRLSALPRRTAAVRLQRHEGLERGLHRARHLDRVDGVSQHGGPATRSLSGSVGAQ